MAKETVLGVEDRELLLEKGKAGGDERGDGVWFWCRGEEGGEESGDDICERVVLIGESTFMESQAHVE